MSDHLEIPDDYFQSVSLDFKKLGLLQLWDVFQDGDPYDIRDIYHAVRLLQITGRQLTTSRSVEVRGSMDYYDGRINTSLGRMALAVLGDSHCLDGYKLSDDTSIDTESEFLLSISDEYVEDVANPSPLIVTQGAKAVAVIKAVGDQTVYGLASRQSATSRIVRGAISSSPAGLDVAALAPSGSAWQVPLQQLSGSRPLRFSTTMLNPHIRELLKCDGVADIDAMTISHDVVASQVAKLLGSAQLLSSYT